MNKQRKRGFAITSQGQTLIEQKRREKGYTIEKLAEVAGINISTLKSLQRRANKEKTTIEAVSIALGIQPIDIVDANEWYPQSENQVKDESNISWLNICHKMLENQQEQQRIRRKASSMGYEVNVHLPLGLVERKQQQRRNENVEKEEIYKLGSEVITKTYQHQEFLEHLISKGDQSKNKHIAIVGEPGAGKTTLLNAVATYIKDETQELPIFISLASLQGMTLTDYVIKRWLPDAARLVNIAPNVEIEEQFKTAFYQGNFWLLLDGVDEIGESSPIQALNKISQELTSWLGQARVILTCRLNVWDATTNNNILPGFNTFKTQEFNHEDVEKFIRKWFQLANKMNHGEKLISQLQQKGNERIRELVTNPLRLCLLGQIFEQNENGKLPETKAQFYEIFTRYFYEWKPELVPDVSNSDQLRQELHQALGKLALAGINSDVRFRLKRSFVVKEMRDEKLFNLACEVGWLNQVDRDTVNDEAVYAFFHPNFQEYFAALVIDDWHYFLTHVPNNPEKGIYLIFESKWKEVILLWFGRNSINKNYKEEFIQALVEFDDTYGEWRFYNKRAYCLAAAGISEFQNCSQSDKIVQQILNWQFFEVIEETHRTKAIDILMDTLFKSKQFLNKNQHYPIVWHSIKSLEKIAVGYERVIEDLGKLLIAPGLSNYYSSLIIEALRKICTNSEKSINTLLKVLKLKGKDEKNLNKFIRKSHQSWLKNANRIIIFHLINMFISQDLAYYLRERDDELDYHYGSLNKILIQIQNKPPIEALVEVLELNNLDQYELETAIKQILLPLKKGNTKEIDQLIKILESTNLDTYTRRIVAEALGEIDLGNKQAIEALKDLLKSKDMDEYFIMLAAESLGKIDPGNEQALEIILKILYSASEDNNMYWSAADSLKNILQPEQLKNVVIKLNSYLNISRFFPIHLYEDVIWHCAQNMTYPEFYRAWHGEPSPIQNLETQFTDTHSHLSQVQPTNTTYPLTLNLKTLQNETDIIEISQEICNQIYFTACPENPEIPQVNNAPQLKSKIPQIKKHLQTENLALPGFLTSEKKTLGLVRFKMI